MRNDYQAANGREIKLSTILTFLEELETGVFVLKNTHGYREGVYNKKFEYLDEQIEIKQNELVNNLMDLSDDDIRDRSLELQMWWRDYLRGQDASSLKKSKELRDGKIREIALSKLSDQEKEVLGLV